MSICEEVMSCPNGKPILSIDDDGEPYCHCTDQCYIKKQECDQKGWHYWERPHGDAKACYCDPPIPPEPPEPRPPSPPKKTPPRKLPPPPEPPRFSRRNKDWWGDGPPAPPAKPPEKVVYIDPLSPDQLKVQDPLPDFIARANATSGREKGFVGGIMKTAKAHGVAGKEVAEVVFVIDNSGSMQSGAALLAASVRQIISGLKAQGTNKVRIGLVLFNDSHSIKVALPLTDVTPETIAQLLLRLNTLRFSGGIEPVGLATAKALDLFSGENKEKTGQMVVVMTDREGLRDDASFSYTGSDARRQAESEGIAVHRFINDNPSQRTYRETPSRRKSKARRTAEAILPIPESVGDVVPQLKPFLDPGGTVEGLRKFYSPGSVPKGSRVREPMGPEGLPLP